MNYLIDYVVGNSKSPYGYQNLNNVYNFIYDMILIENNDEYKRRVLILVKKNIGITFYNNFISYCIKKELDISFI